MVDDVLVLSSLSTQTVWLPVSDYNPISGIIDVSTSGVEVAYTNGSDPISWSTASWETGTITLEEDDTENTYHLAKIVVGPSGLAIAKGFWQLWLKLSITTPSAILRSSLIYVF